MKPDERLKIIDDRYAQRRKAGNAGWADDGSYDHKARSFDRIVAAYNIPKGARILELGCGAGNTALCIAGKGFDAYGIDISPEGIKWAKENAQRRHLEAHFRVGSVIDLQPFEDEFFDMVFDGDCLWMVLGADRPACFASIFRKLKPGGIVYAQAHVVRDGFRKRYDIAPGAYFDPVRLVSTIRDVPIYQFSTESGFRKEIEDAEFEILCSGNVDYDQEADSAAGDHMPFLAGSVFVDARKPTPEKANHGMRATSQQRRA